MARKEETSEGKKVQLPEKKDKLIEKEKSKTGKVKASVYMAYVKSAGIVLPILGVLGVTAQQAALVGSNFWLSDWSDDAVVNGTQSVEQRNVRLGVYGALGIAQGLLATAGAFCLILGGIRSSKTLHKDALLHVLRGSLQYFDVTPLGRIVNRFSQDLNTIDNSMPSIIGMLLNFVLTLMATMLVISISTPIFLAVLLPVAVLYFFIRRFYIATSRQLQRLEAVSRSPIYSHFNETLQGTSVIRAYGRTDQFGRENQDKVDHSQAAAYPGIVATRWLSMGLDVVSSIIIFFAALFAVVGRESLTPGLVGLSISYALQRFYIATSRQLQRLEAVSRSPIYSHFNETLQGTSVIRAYGRTDQFGRENQDKVDHSQAAAYPGIVATSVGQRQLVCLARALLKKSKILVLDEATAAVDLETDDLIQSTIRTQFADCTVLTIAHRLNTIMDSTRVLVLDAGQIEEFDTPENLISAKGMFYGMVKDAGLV
uniref:ABC-type glutathione-S-conjugate transporter n=1 Tax=Branchiostoma floridae TaxID=7739 RepID=C3ZMP2_BRAFL|eukprot:XP_002590138.1 hypothetical protein BRAFLDRAFT_90871 [Branchiostoma floridae]